MTEKTPAAHARLSPSGSKRWFACPGSLTLEAPFPNKSNEYSDDGTAMHDIAARVLTGDKAAADFIGEWVVVSHGDEPVRKVQITEDMADLVQEYVDMVRHVAAGRELHVEQRVEFSKFVDLPDQFGTADFIIVAREQGELIVGDLKTGHKPVSVERNSQALTYALGALGDMYERAQTVKAQTIKALRECGEVLDAASWEDDDDLAG
jgi:hypothetical protein